MPHANIWIRKKNLKKWEAIEDKSEWLNTLLGEADDTSRWGSTIDTPVGPAVVALTEAIPEIPETPIVMERACCLARKPCQHWVYDGAEETWTNSISGRIKEV